MTQKHGSSPALQVHLSHGPTHMAVPGSGTASEGPWEQGDGNSSTPCDSPYLLPIYLYISDVVLKHGGHVDLGELVLAEHDQQARLSAGTISHNHQLLSDGCHRCGDKSR